MGLLVRIGSMGMAWAVAIGRVTALFVDVCRWLIRAFFDRSVRPTRRDMVWQLYFVGIESLPVVLATGAFAGLVLAYSFYFQFIKLGVETWTGPLVAKALVWQLGPVLAGLMLAGRVGSAMAAELGSMVVTEQVDALVCMGVDPVRQLVMPRVVAFTVMTPILTAWVMAVGIGSGILLTVYGLGAEAHYIWNQIKSNMIPYDYVQGLSKSLVFGLLIGLICCRRGLDTRGGAEGVGKATTEANVLSCITVLIMNFWLTMVLHAIGGAFDWI